MKYLALLMILLLNACASSYHELQEAEMDRFHEQQQYWVLRNCDKMPKECEENIRERLFNTNGF